MAAHPLGDRLKTVLLKRLEKGDLVLPTLPRAAAEIQSAIDAPDIDMKRISRALEKDPALAAQVLRSANSAVYGARQRIESITKAVTFLGARNLKSALLTAAARRVFVSRHPKVNETLSKVWEHSVAVAILARDVVGIAGAKDNENTYLAGLLHDVGKAVVAVYLLDFESTLTPREAQNWLDFGEWVQVLEDIHRPIGAAVVEAWKLPETVGQVITQANEYDSGERVSPTNAVRFANALAKHEGICPPGSDPQEVDAVMMIGRSLLGLDDEVVEGLARGLRERVSTTN
jgi:putative nucleotidyltransferase with HDIG domain